MLSILNTVKNYHSERRLRTGSRNAEREKKKHFMDVSLLALACPSCKSKKKYAAVLLFGLQGTKIAAPDSVGSATFFRDPEFSSRIRIPAFSNQTYTFSYYGNLCQVFPPNHNEIIKTNDLGLFDFQDARNTMFFVRAPVLGVTQFRIRSPTA